MILGPSVNSIRNVVPLPTSEVKAIELLCNCTIRNVNHLGRERQFDPERGSSANLRSKIDRTVMQLHNSKRAGQSDSAAAWPRRAKQLKKLLLVFRRDAVAGVAHRNFRH